LGHTGRQLAATAGTQVIYLAVVLAALTRVTAALLNAWTIPLLHLAAFAWIAAFGGFALLYAPLLFRAAIMRMLLSLDGHMLSMAYCRYSRDECASH
jgi:uncharacterized protein involved in response to NO